jgi:GNAT superfamily N-acetyltransferase
MLTNQSAMANLREATPADIPQIQHVRLSVNENKLSNPALVTDDDVLDYITNRGKGWVTENNGIITGFAIVDLVKNNVWALFMHPDHENKGEGSMLHYVMMEWYFSQKDHVIWLSTGQGTRAETFYRKKGWKDAGMHGNEIKFEMTLQDWVNAKKGLLQK